MLWQNRIVDELADSASEASAGSVKSGDRASAQSEVEAQAREGRELLGELLRLVAALLASGPVHREEFLQVSFVFARVTGAEQRTVAISLCRMLLSWYTAVWWSCGVHHPSEYMPSRTVSQHFEGGASWLLHIHNTILFVSPALVVPTLC